MSKYIGIDVGGTATRWAAMDEASVTTKGSGPGATGLMLIGGQTQAFEAALRALELPRPVAGVHAGITGFGPALRDQAVAAIARSLAVAPDLITVSDDMELSFRAVFAPGAGHLVSAGTGSIGLHVATDGQLTRVGGRGMLIDDGGSGTWIALTALDRLYRRIDETGSAGGVELLLAQIEVAVGGSGWEAVRGFIYGGDRGRIGTLARAVAAAADAGDPIAQGVMADAALELARLALALEMRIGPLPVAFIGGVLALSPTVRPALLAALPGREVSFPLADSALAAAHMARQAADIRRNIHR